ncbi:hypothetical protein F5Y10DRAFT_262625 [Nemania abortiva]|nr:hypothetical protein F5Y10DRAFT_262625 [Nemania abortiva]
MPLKRVVSATARQVMQSASDDLEHSITLDDSYEFSSMTLEDVKRAALDIESRLAARQALRNMKRLMPLFEGMEHYSRVVDVLCNGTPYLAWIWAPITLVLRIASEYVEAFEKIMDGYTKIAESLGRFKLLSKALATNTDFQDTLAVFYSDILMFHKNAYQFVRRNSWKLLFMTSWGRFQRQFDNILADMKRHERLVDLQANAYSISDVREMREEIKSWKEKSLAEIQQLNERESSKHMKVWLQDIPDCPLLWLQGAPGSGKSVIASHIIGLTKPSNSFIVRHFCSQRYASSTLYDQILRSILLQLLRHSDELVAHVHKDYVLGKRPPAARELERLLLTLLKVISDNPRQGKYIRIVIDGLNECEPRQQASVMNLIDQIITKDPVEGATVCKVLVSSRASPTLTKRLEKSRVISLTEERNSVKLAIRQYVSQRLQPMHDKLQQLDLGPQEIEEIVRVITNKSNGMFLYARLVLDYLASNIFYSGAEMKSSIDELPRGLTEFYKKIMTQILIRLDKRSVDRLKCIFGWIAFSKRPLKRMEFLSALTFGSGSSTTSQVVPSYVLDICGPLVEERPDTSLIFIHISVKEFLQSLETPRSPEAHQPAPDEFTITEKDATTELCTSTINCLLSGLDNLVAGPEDSKAIRVVKGFHGLHVYATEFWTEHLLRHASLGEFKPDSQIFSLASDLAQRLEKFIQTPDEDIDGVDDTLLNDRVAPLKGQPLLQKHVKAALKARSLKRLESNIIEETSGASTVGKQHQLVTLTLNKSQTVQGPEHPIGKDGVSAMLLSYQEVVRFLLQQNTYPSVSLMDLNLWKSQFRNSAFTCRLSYCPRATEGFVSEDLRRQHEMAHTRLIMCAVPDCKYPPFLTSRALTSHMNKFHVYKPARRPLRPERPMTASKTSGMNTVIQTKSAHLDQLNEGLSSENHQEAHFHTASRSAQAQIEASGYSQVLERRGPLQSTSRDGAEVSSSPERSEVERGHDESLTVDMALDAIEINMEPNGFGRIGSTIDLNAFRVCAMPGCLKRLRWHEPENSGASHYWYWHHSDSIAQCAHDTCREVFPSREHLEAHYEQRHTFFLCKHCEGLYKLLDLDRQLQDLDLPDEMGLYGSVEELWQHLGTCHQIKRWMCGVPPHQIHTPYAVAVPFDQCVSCAFGKKYERFYDAIQHLASVHFPDLVYEPNIELLPHHILREHVVEEWGYGVENERKEPVPMATGIQSWYSHDSEDEEDEDIEMDNMFHVPELA